VQIADHCLPSKISSGAENLVFQSLQFQKDDSTNFPGGSRYITSAWTA
jgi:hypothetical protein